MQEGFSNSFMLLLVLLALVAAWLLGRRSQAQPYIERERERDLSRDYFVGLNYLLNDEPDDAIDTFINALEINSATLDTHIALGVLLRRRGKVDRSILVYEGLLARELSAEEASRVKLEATRSYIAAGLLDRAEMQLEELEGAGVEARCESLALSINLFQLEKEWEKAAGAATELYKICEPGARARFQNMASHFYCELAEEEIGNDNYSRARQLLKRADQCRRGNVRVSLLKGRLEMALDNPEQAIRSLLKVRRQDADFESEAVLPLLECYHRIGSEKHLRKFIQRSLHGQPAASVLLGISDYIERQEGAKEALVFLQQQLRQKPSLRLMNRAQALMSLEVGGQRQENLQLFHDIVDGFINARPQYQCVNCGFETKFLHWQCPSCAAWGEVKPIRGLVGE